LRTVPHSSDKSLMSHRTQARTLARNGLDCIPASWSLPYYNVPKHIASNSDSHSEGSFERQSHATIHAPSWTSFRCPGTGFWSTIPEEHSCSSRSIMGSRPFRSPLLRLSRLIIPSGTEMFHFPDCFSIGMFSQGGFPLITAEAKACILC